MVWFSLCQVLAFFGEILSYFNLRYFFFVRFEYHRILVFPFQIPSIVNNLKFLKTFLIKIHRKNSGNQKVKRGNLAEVKLFIKQIYEATM